MQGEMENKMVADRRSPEWMGLRVVGEHRFARSPVRSELQSQQRTQFGGAKRRSNCRESLIAVL